MQFIICRCQLKATGEQSIRYCNFARPDVVLNVVALVVAEDLFANLFWIIGLMRDHGLSLK
jgi:hypothetical protein